MQSGREDTLEERYGIKFCFKLGKIEIKEAVTKVIEMLTQVDFYGALQ